MTNEITMSEKKEEGEVGVACPLCLKKGKQSKVRLFQINFSEALVSCEDSQCPFPLMEGHLANIVRRDFMGASDEVSVGKESANDSTEENAVSNSECSSQNRPAMVEETQRVTLPDLSASTDKAVIDTSASSSEIKVNKFEKYEFTATAQQDIKKKPKRKYYTGSRKKKVNRKPNSTAQNGDVEPES